MTARSERIGVWTVALAASGMVVAAELRRRAIAPDTAALTVGAVAGPVFAVLGLLILERRRRHGLGLLYLAIGASLSLFAFTNVPGGVDLPVAAIWFNSWNWVMAPLALLTYGTFLLPDGRVPAGATGRWAARAATAAVAISAVYLPYDLEDMPPPLAAALPAIPAAILEVAFVVWVGITLGAVLLSFVAVVVRYRRGSVLERQRLRWIAACAGLAILTYATGDLTTRLPGLTWERLSIVVVLLPAVGVTVAIVRHRMFDIDRLVARTLSYAVVTVAVVAIYLGAILLASAALPAAGDSDLVVAVSTLGAAAAFRPLRRRVQTVVDRRFHRSRYDADRLVGAFSARLRDQVDLATVAAELVATSATSLRPASISLWTGTPTGRGNGSGTLATYNRA